MAHFVLVCVCVCQAEQSATILGCADPDSAEDIDCFTALYLQPVTWWTFVSWIIVGWVLKLHRSEQTIAENSGIGAIPPRGFAHSVACLKISWFHWSIADTRRLEALTGREDAICFTCRSQRSHHWADLDRALQEASDQGQSARGAQV